jgi:hypothetical protein
MAIGCLPGGNDQPVRATRAALRARMIRGYKMLSIQCLSLVDGGTDEIDAILYPPAADVVQPPRPPKKIPQKDLTESRKGA